MVYSTKKRNKAVLKLYSNLLAQEQNSTIYWLIDTIRKIKNERSNMFYTNSKSFYLWELISQEYGSGIKDKLEKVQLKNDLCWNLNKIPNDILWADTFNSIEDAKKACVTFLDKVIADIQYFLKYGIIANLQLNPVLLDKPPNKLSGL